jgi:hypothetical protein
MSHRDLEEVTRTVLHPRGHGYTGRIRSPPISPRGFVMAEYCSTPLALRGVALVGCGASGVRRKPKDVFKQVLRSRADHDLRPCALRRWACWEPIWEPSPRCPVDSGGRLRTLLGR